MAANTRTKLQRSLHREQIARFLAENMSRTEIQAKLDISWNMLYYDIRLVEEKWQESAIESTAVRKTQECKKLNYLETNYWEAWRESGKTDLEALKGVERCIELRSKLMGLFKEALIDLGNVAAVSIYLPANQRDDPVQGPVIDVTPALPGGDGDGDNGRAS